MSIIKTCMFLYAYAKQVESGFLKNLGWRLVEVEEEKQVKLKELLKDISSKALRKRRRGIAKIKP